MDMKIYKDKHGIIVKDADYIYVDEKVCQALRCDDGTLLYEELYYSNLLKDLDIADEPLYPDAYEPHEIEIISYNIAVELLKEYK